MINLDFKDKYIFILFVNKFFVVVMFEKFFLYMKWNKWICIISVLVLKIVWLLICKFIKCEAYYENRFCFLVIEELFLINFVFWYIGGDFFEIK